MSHDLVYILEIQVLIETPELLAPGGPDISLNFGHSLSWNVYTNGEKGLLALLQTEVIKTLLDRVLKVTVVNDFVAKVFSFQAVVALVEQGPADGDVKVR